MNFWQRSDKIQALRSVPLEKVLGWCGARRDRADHNKWHTDKGVLSIHSAKFINWSLAVGGGGAIDLVMHLRALDFKAAVDWLARQSGELLLSALPPATAMAPPLELPSPDRGRLGAVKDYLVRERALPFALLEPLIEAGTLYADHRTNAVFLLRGQGNVPVGAELRGTLGRKWRGLAPGSRKDLGFFGLVAPTPATLILCESAIDALSCRALHPEHGSASTAGVRPNPRWLAPLLSQGQQIYCGFDRDVIGEQMARAMIALHPAIQRLRPAAHDWNDQLKLQRQICTGHRALTTWKEESATLTSPFTAKAR